MIDSDSAAPGIHLHHGNRLESLALALADCLNTAPADPLQSDIVLVPHPGMAQWLKMRLADALGIGANLEFPLPAVWFGRLAATGLAQADNQAWSREALAWRLFGCRGDSAGPLSALRESDDRTALTRWQLAGQIAELFDRYQLQRPAWLRGWLSANASSFTDSEAEAWQASLWRQLVSQSSPGQRQALVRRLDPRAPPDAELPARLFAFGFATLPDRFLDGLWALAERMPVHLFFPNPCRWYWADVLAEREQLVRSRRLGYKTGLDPDAEGHPLLARLGATARDFLHRLYAREILFASETDYFEPMGRGTVLSQVQNRLLDLDDGALRWAPDDGSIRWLAAPNRRREIEALHDVLLGLFDDPSLEDLRPSEIAVMVPKLSDYAPMIEAVFGAQPRDRRIPWQLTDLNETERHPLPALFLRLIDLPVWRFGLSEVLDALARPAFQSAFGIHADELPRLAALLEDAGARWGLDADFRKQSDTGDDAAYTFRFAIDRLLTGWLLGEGADIAAGVAPYTALRGADADLIGRFVACLAALDGWRSRLAASRRLGEWASMLVDLRDACLTESVDQDENAALLRLTGALDRWMERSVAASEIEVPRRVIRDAIAESLSSHAVSALPGEGVNICAMVPLRGLPFRAIVLLGLGEGEFPRRERELPGDLCRVAPRPGDRSVVVEDRYLILEALVSARDVLVFSHVDRDAGTGQPRAASAVLGEVRDYLCAAAFAGDQEAFEHRVEHVAQQPFDLRHFAPLSNTRHVPSYMGEWLVEAESVLPRSALQPVAPVSWEDMRTFLIDPARTQVRWRGAHLGERDDPVEDDEPFALDGLAAYRARHRVLDALVSDASTSPVDLADRLRAEAMLPPGHAGERAFATVWESAWGTHRAFQAVAAGRPLTEFTGRRFIDGVDFDVRIGDADAGGVVRLSAGRLNGKRRLAAWLDMLVLCLMRDRCDLSAVLVGLDDTIVLPAPADPRAELRRLLEIWHQARSTPVPIYPATSAAYAAARCGPRGDAARAAAKARAAWHGDGHRPGEREDVACRELARCFPTFDIDPFADLALGLYAPVFAESEQ